VWSWLGSVGGKGEEAKVFWFFFSKKNRFLPSRRGERP
jgi:hypothetical protein